MHIYLGNKYQEFNVKWFGLTVTIKKKLHLRDTLKQFNQCMLWCERKQVNRGGFDIGQGPAPQGGGIHLHSVLYICKMPFYAHQEQLSENHFL